MDVKEIVRDDVNWTHLAWDRLQCLDFVNTEMKL